MSKFLLKLTLSSTVYSLLNIQYLLVLIVSIWLYGKVEWQLFSTSVITHSIARTSFGCENKRRLIIFRFMPFEQRTFFAFTSFPSAHSWCLTIPNNNDSPLVGLLAASVCIIFYPFLNNELLKLIFTITVCIWCTNSIWKIINQSMNTYHHDTIA